MTNPDDLQAAKARVERLIAHFQSGLPSALPVNEPWLNENIRDLRLILQALSEMEGGAEEATRPMGDNGAMADAALSMVETRMRARVEVGVEHVAIGQHFAREVVAACERGRSTISALTRRVEKLKRALKLAATWFREYERGHLAKATEDGNDKASRNRERAKQLEAALNEDEGHG